MKNISICFEMHVPYRLKRYRFFDIGQDHYYYDDMATEEYIEWLVRTSYMPLCNTLKEIVQFSKARFHFGIAVSGITLTLFEQFAPEMIDVLKELAASKAVEFVGVPFSYSLASERDENEFERQLRDHSDLINELFGQKPSVLWNTELLYHDEIAPLAYKLGYKTIMTEGAKHILSWQSPNYVYQSAGHNKVKMLVRNREWSDELSFHFSDPAWTDYPLDAESYAQKLAELPTEEEVINIWCGAETFGILQQERSGIFNFLRALPYYAMEREMCFVTPSEAVKGHTPTSVLSALHPLTWAGEAKDLSLYLGNDLQQEALNKLFAVAERVHLCRDKQLQTDWKRLQDITYLHFMNHIDQGATQYESAYDAFINYMNILADFLQKVEEQYPTTIDNEELNELLKTIDNQEKEIAELNAKLAKRASKK